MLRAGYMTPGRWVVGCLHLLERSALQRFWSLHSRGGRNGDSAKRQHWMGGLNALKCELLTSIMARE